MKKSQETKYFEVREKWSTNKKMQQYLESVQQYGDAAVIASVKAVKGCDPPVEILESHDDAVYNNMPTHTCIDAEPWDTQCLTDWSWELTTCSDMMPFKINGAIATGVFTGVSNWAKANGIHVGSNYKLSFAPVRCEYALVVDGVLKEMGMFHYERASHSSISGGGGFHRAATLEFQPLVGEPWNTLWIANDRFAGSMQSKLGLAEFTIHPVNKYYKKADNAHQ
ncbi:MAG: hypothetical protein K0U52_03690 [Gammaproteobacteria bacterium]|nr:hypothetical protein [Gammaproteobacteria bacterium]